MHFWSEATHDEEVRGLLRKAGRDTRRIVPTHIVFRWSRNQYRRLIQEVHFCRRVLRFACERQCFLVVFCSVSSLTLFALKFQLRAQRLPLTVVAIPHAVLAGLLCRAKRVWNWPLSIGAALAVPSPRNLKLIALSQTIYGSVAHRYDRNQWYQMNHPYLFDPAGAANGSLPEPCADKPLVRVGLIGALRARFADYCALLRDVTSTTSRVQFILVGHLKFREGENKRLLRYLKEGPNTPLPYHEYSALARSVDYFLCLSDPRFQRYVASGTLLDALNYQKPGFYLKTPLLEEYHAKLGDFAYLCDSVSELAQTLVGVSLHFPLERYARQVAAAGKARDLFSPEAVAAQFKWILDGRTA